MTKQLSRLIPALSLAFALAAFTPGPARAAEVKLAVAANFAAPMKALQQRFEAATSHTLLVSYGSSGKLYTQLKNGAPFEVFLSADADRPRLLEEARDAVAGRQPIEPIDVPPSIEQGLDMVYIDREMAPSIEQRDEQLQAQGYDDFKVAPVDMFAPVHPLYTDLRRALIRYQMRWGSLPQVQVASGPTLKLNSTGDRVAVLRQRLGLPEGTKFDAATAAAVKEFQGVHGF
jgi:hypothetical protein